MGRSMLPTMRLPMLPPEDSSATLVAGAVALGVSLTPGQMRRLAQYRRMLAKWGRVHNLTAIRDDDTTRLHLLDALALVAPLRRHAAGRTLRLLDVGSGAGLPGLIVAIAMPADEVQVCCLDAVAKKAAFIRQAVAELGLAHVCTMQGRIEALRLEPFDVITSRAFASLADFARLSERHLASDGVWLAMKGRRPDEEIAQLPPHVSVFHVEPVVVPGLAARRCLIWMRKTTSSHDAGRKTDLTVPGPCASVRKLEHVRSR